MDLQQWPHCCCHYRRTHVLDGAVGPEGVQDWYRIWNDAVLHVNKKPTTKRTLHQCRRLFQQYPYDASMAAALVRGYRLLGNETKGATDAQQFARLLEESAYRQRRVQEFPELSTFVEVTGV
jgi:hypothetical protein